ncbi:MAG: recombination-associated protein RdgC, partial [Desulfobulbaceae bacterium]|nr:recombination-associated protein RdgC [Desulfobulbaceae bacterium]
MGLLSSSSTFVRYKVEGNLPDNFMDFADGQIKRFSFRDIDDTYDEFSVGWVSVLNMFDAEFQYASFSAGDYICLTMRMDERKVSPKILKKFCLKEEERIKRDRQIPKLNRHQKLEIKENMQLMLMKRAMPVPATYDLVWSLADNSLLFFSTNQKAHELLEDFFKECFGMLLLLQVPYNIAESMLDATEKQA